MNQTDYKSSIRKDSDLRKDIINATSMQQQRPKTSSFISRENRPVFSLNQQPIQEGTISSDRNVKFKLEQLEEKLSDVLNNIRLEREELRENLSYTSQLKGNLIYSHLYDLKKELDGRMQGLLNQIRHRRQSDEQRYRSIRKQCSNIWEATEQAREKVFQLQLRVERLEERLGFKEIYRLEYY